MKIERRVKKLNKWLDRLRALIDNDERSRSDSYTETRIALKKLKKHSRDLRHELDRKVLSPERRKSLEQDLAIVKRQRQKGIAILKQLKSGAHDA